MMTSQRHYLKSRDLNREDRNRFSGSSTNSWLWHRLLYLSDDKDFSSPQWICQWRSFSSVFRRPVSFFLFLLAWWTGILKLSPLACVVTVWHCCSCHNPTVRRTTRDPTGGLQTLHVLAKSGGAGGLSASGQCWHSHITALLRTGDRYIAYSAMDLISAALGTVVCM